MRYFDHVIRLIAMGTAVMGAFNASAQCSLSVTTCSDQTIWYLDIDGDGVGVDDPQWNRYCCNGAEPESSMYAIETAGDDINPNDESISTTLIPGCTFEEACNYDSSANSYDGNCLFPINCQECELDATGQKTGNYNPDGPCDCDLNSLDALGICGGNCLADVDNDGICDELDDGTEVDLCLTAGEEPDDCGHCAAIGGGTQFTTSTGLPCAPGSPDCTDQNGFCDCASEDGVDAHVMNACGECGVPNPVGIDCDGNLICIDVIPSPNGNNTCDEFDIIGCTDTSACNFRLEATYGVIADECTYTIDECGVCGGNGIPEGACDCDTYQEPFKECDGSCTNDVDPANGICDELEILGCTDADACNFNSNATKNSGCVLRDAIGECGGDCSADADNDNICDAVDSCVGTFDECGICNGDGIPTGLCDCFGNSVDIFGECAGGCLQDSDQDGICDLDENGNVADDFICPGEADAIGICNGTCQTDADGDGICDDDGEDTCIGTIDACGICNGTGIPSGDCDCNGNESDALGACGGGCQLDADGDGICDDNGNDECQGTLDVCGVCDGTGIPTGDCDCYGNQADILGNCGGNCISDIDEDGVCDLDGDGNVLDGCVGEVDACNVCNGTGPLDGCGCEPVWRGECDCDGHVLDECGECGGDGPDYGKDCAGNCLSDEDNDGICDASDPRIIPRLIVEDDNAPGQMNLPPFNVKDAYDDLISMHRAMGDNLDDGSLTGTSKHLTVQDHVHDKGKLLVVDTATFESNVVVNGFVQIDKSLDINGDFLIDGVTFSNGGVESSIMDNSGDFHAEGTTMVTMNTEIQGATSLINVAGTSGDFRVHDGLAGGDFDPTFGRVKFSVAPSTGNVRMSGDLDADGDVSMLGKATLNGLNVDGSSRFGSLTMDGALDLNSSAAILGNLRVNGSKFTINGSTGNTRTEGNTEVDQSLTVKGLVHIQQNMTIEGTTFANGGVETTSVEMDGDLQVGGNTNIGQDFSVGGVTTVMNDLNMGSDFSIFDGNTSTFETANFHVSPTSGNLTNKSGFSAQNFNLESHGWFSSNVEAYSNLNAAGPTSLDGLTVSGYANFKTGSTGAAFNGATVFSQSATIQGNLTTKGSAQLGGLTIPKNLTTENVYLSGTPQSGGFLLDVTGKASENNAFVHFVNESSTGHGIQVQLGSPAPGNTNHYVTFQSANGSEVGRIEGETTGELNNNEMWAFENNDVDLMERSARLAKDVAETNHTITSVGLAAAIAKQVAACVSFTGCAGFGFCAAMPIPALIAGAAANIISAGIGLADAIVAKNQANSAYTRASNAKNQFVTNTYSKNHVNANGTMVGVTYQSGSADYAEWLPKANPLDDFEPGQLVGIKEGHISLNTAGADHIFVISTQPIVLGNTPINGREADYEKAAFMGQVPVQVLGTVHTGDFIVASGNSDGYAMALDPSKLKGQDLKQVVGIAWEDGHASFLNVINVAVGLSDGLQGFAAAMDQRLDALESESDALEKLIHAKMKGDKINVYQLQKAGLVKPLIVPEEYIQYDEPNWSDASSWNTPSPDDFVMHEITEEAMEYSWELAVQQTNSFGINMKQSPSWQLFLRDEAARKDFLNDLRNQINDHNAGIIAELSDYESVQFYDPTPADEFIKQRVKSPGEPPNKKENQTNAQKRQ